MPQSFTIISANFLCMAFASLRAGRPGFNCRAGAMMEIFLFVTASRTTLGPTQLPIAWLSGDLSSGVKRPKREFDHSFPSSTEVMNARSYTSISQFIFMAWCTKKVNLYLPMCRAIKVYSMLN